MGHTVGKQAERAVENSTRADSMKMTPDQLIQALRNNLRGNLFVPSHQIDALLQQYDLAKGALIEVYAELAGQKAVNETYAELVRFHEDGGPVPSEE